MCGRPWTPPEPIVVAPLDPNPIINVFVSVDGEVVRVVRVEGLDSVMEGWGLPTVMDASVQTEAGEEQVVMEGVVVDAMGVGVDVEGAAAEGGAMGAS